MLPACCARGRVRDLTGFLATRPMPLPCSKTPAEPSRASPLAALPTPPPVYPNRRPQRVHNLEANTGLQHPQSTLHEWRRRPPCKTRFRLAGCAFAGRGSNPLGRFERFQVTSPSSFPGLLLSQGSSIARRRLRDPNRCCAISPVTPIVSPSRIAASLQPTALSDQFFGSSLAVVASGHEQPVPLFQQLARDNSSGGADVREVYPLSLRNVEDLLAERGIDISHETVRF